MTIAAAYLVSEGVVLGTDSTSTISVKDPKGGPGGVLQLLNHAQKVFEVGENSRLGICTWGAASVGGISHRTIVARLDEEVKKNDNMTVEETAKALVRIVEKPVKDTEVEFVGYYLGGWNPKSHDPACFKIEFSRDKKPNIAPVALGTCMFSGNANIFRRVFRGFDPMLYENLLNELKKRVPENIKDFEKIFKESFEIASKPLIAVGHRDLPIREAIDFVHSYLHITIKATKFMFGAAACGGPIEIGFITTDRFFRWARHKNFETAIQEQEGEYEFRG